MRVFLLYLLLLGSSSQGQGSYQYQNSDHYNFSYRVGDDHSGNQFGHSENRISGATAGAYHVLLPDGRVQTVQYTVDGAAGFQATVQYEGKAQKEATPNQVYSTVKAAHAPVYRQNYGRNLKKQQELVKPAFSPVKSVYPSVEPTQYQTSYSNPHPVYTQYNPNQNNAPPKVVNPLKRLYNPTTYLPAPVSDPVYQQVHMLKVLSHHRQTETQLTLKIKPKPASEPHHKNSITIQDKFDPYLVTEEELKGRSFSDPFWYPKDRKIMKKNRKEDPEKKNSLHSHL